MCLILLSAGKIPIKSFEVGILAAKNPGRSGYRKQTIFFVWPDVIFGMGEHITHRIFMLPTGSSQNHTTQERMYMVLLHAYPVYYIPCVSLFQERGLYVLLNL